MKSTSVRVTKFKVCFYPLKLPTYTIECSLYVCILLRFVQVLVLVVGMSNLITRVLLVKMDQLTTKHDML